MAENPDLEAREAKYGQKMISVNVRFWTDALAEQQGKIIPKHAWVHGVVHLETNPSHGIQPSKPIPFNSLMELPLAIEELFIREGITLHPNPKMEKYLAGGRKS